MVIFSFEGDRFVAAVNLINRVLGGSDTPLLDKWHELINLNN